MDDQPTPEFEPLTDDEFTEGELATIEQLRAKAYEFDAAQVTASAFSDEDRPITTITWAQLYDGAPQIAVVTRFTDDGVMVLIGQAESGVVTTREDVRPSEDTP